MIVEFIAYDEHGFRICDTIFVSDDIGSDAEIIEIIEDSYGVTDVDLKAFNS